MFDIVNGSLASAVADAGTVTVSYPSLRSKGNYVLASPNSHKLILNGNLLSSPNDFTITFNANASSITLTNKTGASWAQGSTFKLQLDRGGPGQPTDQDVLAAATISRQKVAKLIPVLIDLGSPNVLDADGICESQNRTGAGVLLINGALSDGDLATSVATLDVPRNVIADSGGADTAVITVTGTDTYGNVMKENITLNGTTAVAGKKAFKTITAVTSDATISNGFFLGTGDVLGLPIALPKTGCIIKELEDGAAATAGTTVAAVYTEATATTGDVRGTYDPNSACDGDKGFVLFAMVPSTSNLGVAQYAG